MTIQLCCLQNQNYVKQTVSNDLKLPAYCFSQVIWHNYLKISKARLIDELAMSRACILVNSSQIFLLLGNFSV